MNEELPISPNQAIKAHQWLQDNFKDDIQNAIKETNYSHELVSAIFSQETAQRVLLWVEKYEPDIILQRSIFDASGDFPNTTRNAFPKNAAAFHDKYGDEFTDMLISEGNKMRRMPQPGNPNGYSDSHYLYKGYGLFQYDLQNVLTDELFFLHKQWYNFNECIKRLIQELQLKARRNTDLWDIVKAYNGAGQNATNYANNVFKFMDIIKKATL